MRKMKTERRLNRMNRRTDIGWTELIFGLVLIVFGVIMLRQPAGVLTWLVVICGIIAIFTGIGDIILYVKMERFTGFGPVISLVTGILSVMAGFMLLVYPGAGTWALAMVLPIWIIAHCISRLSHLNYVRFRLGTTYYYLTMIVNILGLIAGILLVFRPAITIFSIGFLVGLYLILEGIDCIMAALGGRNYYR